MEVKSSEGLLWLRLLCSNLFLNQVEIALFGIASLFIFFKEHIICMKHAKKILSNIEIMQKIMDSYVYLETGVDGLA